MIESLVLSGWICIVAIIVLGLEALLVLSLLKGRNGGRKVLVPWVANLCAGLFLILALRAALFGSGAIAIAIWLSLGFAAHIADSWSRLSR